MSTDLRETPEYQAIAEHLRRLHEPGLGHPHDASEPDVTGDGSGIVVTGSVFDELTGHPRTSVFSVENGKLRAVTSGHGSARWGRFSPDGRTLAFLSDRDVAGRFQLFLLADDHFGEAEPATAVPGTVEYAHWSPDGSTILLGVAGVGADIDDGHGSGTVGGATAGLPSWHPVIEAGPPEDAWRSLWLYSIGTDALTQLSPPGLNCWEAGWCGPDQIAAITSPGFTEDDWYGAVLTMIDRSTGQTRELLTSDVQLGLPAGSADGASLAVIQAVCSDRWIVAGDLIVLDLATGARRVIDTGGTDVTCVQWLGSDRIGYLGLRHLDSVAAIADLATGELVEVLSTTASGGSKFYPAGAFTDSGAVVLVQDGYRLPHQVVLASPGQERVLASVAHPGSEYLMTVAGSAQALSWEAPDGTEIEGILCVPDGDGPFPLVVHIHGGPIGAYRDTWSMGDPSVPLLVSRGYAVLNPNPRGSTGRGQKFAALVVGDMGGADTYDYLSGIDHLVGLGIADPDRIGLMGVSYGGFMAAWLITQHQRFAAAVAGSPVTDWYSQTFTTNIPGWGRWFLDHADPEQPDTQAHTRSPVLHASKASTPCLLTAGAMDRCTPQGQAREFYQALRAQGVESELAIYPEEGHGVRAYPAVTDYLTRLVTWFGRHMPASGGKSDST